MDSIKFMKLLAEFQNAQAELSIAQSKVMSASAELTKYAQENAEELEKYKAKMKLMFPWMNLTW